MLTKIKMASWQTGLFIVALTVGACSSSSSGGAGGAGGSAGTVGAAGTDGGTAGTVGSDAAAGTTGSDAAAGTTGSDASPDTGTDASDSGTLTPQQVNDMLINAPTTSGITITRAAPKVYSNGTCQ